MGAPSGPRYQVTTNLLSVKGKGPMACYTTLTSFPPAGCGGVPVQNVDLKLIPGTTFFPNGTIETPAVRLVGVWSGHDLTLIEPPKPTKGDASTVPAPAPTPESLGLQVSPPTVTSEGIFRDSAELRAEGVLILEAGYGAEGLEVLLAVADANSVRTIYEKYGAVHLSGWLQPA